MVQALQAPIQATGTQDICTECGMSRTALRAAAQEGDIIAQEAIRFAVRNCKECSRVFRGK